MEDLYPMVFIDVLLLTFLVWKIIKEIVLYDEWVKFGCNKPFGLFLIIHSFDIIMFRVFYYLQRHWYYRRVLARLAQSAELEVRAYLRAKIMGGFKHAASLISLVLTFWGTLWFVEDHKTCNGVLPTDLRNWLILSWGISLVYVGMLIWNRKTRVSSEYQTELVHRINSRDAIRVVIVNRQEEVKEGLSEAEIQSIEKWKLSRMSELKMIVTWSDNFESSDEFQSVCSICIENIKINDWYKQLPKCEHYFHADCIDKWLRVRDSCPLCRQIVET